ncbi:MAG: nucleotidyltransferase domain-containing protein [Oscillospiraceae bacterium]|nr:nucleotidyltransferase domain-containing protein [Oscillospiraceae bacterium]
MSKKDEKVEQFFSDFKKMLENTDNFVACYLIGSYAYGTYVDKVSDLDITIIFDGDNFEKQKRNIEKMTNKYDLEIHVCYFSKQYIFKNQNSDDIRNIWNCKITNYFICGEDILQKFELPNVKDYIKNTLMNTLNEIKELKETNLTNYQDKYLEIKNDIKLYITLRDGKPCTKQAVVVCTMMAATFIAKDFSIYSASKDHAINNYKDRYDDGMYMFEIFDACKYKWKYQVPKAEEDLKIFEEYCKYLTYKKNQLLEKFNEYIGEENEFSLL